MHCGTYGITESHNTLKLPVANAQMMASGTVSVYKNYPLKGFFFVTQAKWNLWLYLGCSSLKMVGEQSHASIMLQKNFSGDISEMVGLIQDL